MIIGQLSQAIHGLLAPRHPEGIPEGFHRLFAGGVFSPISMILLLIGSIITIVSVVLSPSKKENNGFRARGWAGDHPSMGLHIEYEGNPPL